jgi:hypothetical protein
MSRRFLGISSSLYLNKGLVLKPQSSAPTEPVNGDIYYDSTDGKVKIYKINQWVELAGSSSSSGSVFTAQGALVFPDGSEQTTAYTGQASGGGSSASPATASALGLIQLAGDLGGTASAPTVPGLAAKVDSSEKGIALGIATLDADGKLESTQMPALTKAMVSLSNVSDVAQMPLSYLDTDGTFVANSDVKVASQKAVKAYVDAAVAGKATEAYADAAVAGKATTAYVDAADASLQSQIDNVLSNIDPTSLDSLSEVVAAFEAADTNLNNAITSLASSKMPLSYLDNVAFTLTGGPSPSIAKVPSSYIVKTYVDEMGAYAINTAHTYTYNLVDAEVSSRQIAVNAAFSEITTAVAAEASARDAAITAAVAGKATTAYVDSAVAGASSNVAVDTVTAATYTATASNGVILASGAANAITITLPTAVGYTGKKLDIKKTDATANAITVSAVAAQTIDGATSKVITTQYQNITLVSDGANWFLI